MSTAASIRPRSASEDRESQSREVAALTTLLDIALELSTVHDEDRILELVTRGACAAVPCERTSLFLLDYERKELFTRTVTELEIREIRLPWDRGVIGWVARECKTTCVSDPPSDNRWDPSIDRQTGFLTRNILAVPVLSPSDARLLGVLQLINAEHGPFAQFDTRIAQAFAAHAATALERTRLQREAQLAAGWRREMELARRIQKGFLPNQTPDVVGYEFAAWWQPAEFVSGDYYDWFPLSDQRLGLVAGDVCGHGLGPSLIMASLRAMLRVLSSTTSDPAAMLSLLANALQSDLKESQFVTLILAALDPATHTFHYANAGHAPALHFRKRPQEISRLRPTRMPLGFPAIHTDPALHPVALEPGDLIVLGTDGIIEARNPQQELFGMERLTDLIRSRASAGVHDLTAAISRAVTEFQSGAPLTDDATLLIVSRRE